LRLHGIPRLQATHRLLADLQAVGARRETQCGVVLGDQRLVQGRLHGAVLNHESQLWLAERPCVETNAPGAARIPHMHRLKRVSAPPLHGRPHTQRAQHAIGREVQCRYPQIVRAGTVMLRFVAGIQ
jgi:hypothetical protein